MKLKRENHARGAKRESENRNDSTTEWSERRSKECDFTLPLN
jgi:hypothetical protein